MSTFLKRNSGPPAEHASTQDIVFAAGFYEGDGYCYYNKLSETVRVGQKDPEILHRLRAKFGGVMRKDSDVTERGTPRTIYTWQITGARARGFLMSIYGLLSQRRQGQIRKTMRLAEFA